MTKYIKIKSKLWILAKEFDVLHSGWESDSKAYLASDPGDRLKLRLVFTDHGQPYFPSQEEVRKKLQEYREALYDLEDAAMTVFDYFNIDED